MKGTLPFHAPDVRNWGEERRFRDENDEGGLNPLRGPSAALAAQPHRIAGAGGRQDGRMESTSGTLASGQSRVTRRTAMRVRKAFVTMLLLTGFGLTSSRAAAQPPQPPPAEPAPQLPAVSPVATEAPPPIGIVPPAGVAGPVVSLTGCVARMDGIETKRPLDRPVTTFFVLQQASNLQVVAVDQGQPAPSTAVLAGRATYGLISSGQDVILENHRGHRVEVTGSFRSPAGLGPTVGATVEDPNALVPMIVRQLKMLDSHCSS
jgi:hypothetical protein